MNTLKSPKTYLLGVLALLLLPAQLSFAQTIKELKASVSIIEQYDDNVFLQADDEPTIPNSEKQSDYITRVRPSFDFKLLSEHTDLGLRYTPTFVWYAQLNENTIGHRGDLSFKQDLSEHLRFYLNDTFIYSDDPLSEENVTERVGGDRRTREDYMINTGNAELSYLFGPENTLTVGYKDQRVRNDDEREEDGTIINPYTSISYSIDIRNKLEIEYGYQKARYWGGNSIFTRSDFTGHDPKITYFYKFTPHTTGALGYSFSTRNFDGADFLDEDYKVHDASAAFEHSFSPDFSISAGTGYFVQKRDISSDQGGLSYNLSCTKSFERGNIFIGGSGGWSENSLLSNSDNRGFSEFWNAGASGEYQILNRLSGHANLYYRHDKKKNENKTPAFNSDYIKWEKIRANFGLSWLLLPKFSLRLDYDYNDRTDDVAIDEYTDQRVTLTLHYSKPSKW